MGKGTMLIKLMNDPSRHVNGPGGQAIKYRPTARGFSAAKKTTVKRKPTKKQLAALAKGRKILAQKYK